MMTRRNEGEGTDSIKITGPMGASVEARGGELRTPLLVIALVASVLYLGWLHHIVTTHNDELMLEQMSEMVYLLSLTQEERTKLNIAMPESLRRKLKSRQQ